MRLSSLLAIAVALGPAFAQSNLSSTSVTDQSADFKLVVRSTDSSLDGSLLGACHNGAAHEALCVVDGSYNYTSSFVNFQYNTTRNICSETNSTGTFTIPCLNEPVDPTDKTGTVTWWLYFTGENGVDRVSQALVLEYVPWSNVAQASITFAQYGSGTAVAFDNECLLNIKAYYDDTLEPASEYLPVPATLYRWYICGTYYVGYRYTALTWALGSAPPQNPTCQKVDIERVWV